MTYKCREVWGYFERTSYQYVDKKLERMPYAQCGVIFTDSGVNFISYTTLVCSIENGWLSCTGTYSQTTRKQIGAFLKEYAPKCSYYTAKRCFEEGIKVNIDTLETLPL